MNNKKYQAANTDSAIESLYWVCDESGLFSDVYKEMPKKFSEEWIEFCRKVELKAFAEGIKIGIGLSK